MPQINSSGTAITNATQHLISSQLEIYDKTLNMSPNQFVFDCFKLMTWHTASSHATLWHPWYSDNKINNHLVYMPQQNETSFSHLSFMFYIMCFYRWILQPAGTIARDRWHHSVLSVYWPSNQYNTFLPSNQASNILVTNMIGHPCHQPDYMIYLARPY